MNNKVSSIRLLIVEDSLTYQEYYRQLFSAYPTIQIVSMLSSGEEAMNQISILKPDIIIMDYLLPGMDGLATTKKIMLKYPTSIIIVSAKLHRDNIEDTFSALEAGAMALIEKPDGLDSPRGEQQGKDLVDTIVQIAKAKLFKNRKESETVQKKKDKPESDLFPNHLQKHIKYIMIGSSTGGPDALQRIFAQVKENIPFSILVVQHIAKGFLASFIVWLRKTAKVKIEIAGDQTIPLPGTVYFAPDAYQMGIDKQGKICLKTDESDYPNCPAVSYLFSSFIPFASDSITILLSGMGQDGVKEMLELKQKGSFTVIQDSESSFIYGMPQEAKKINAHCIESSPEEIAEMLNKWV